MIGKRKYSDGNGNTYQVERASNGKFISVRINSGGNRKLASNVGPAASTEERAQRVLDFAASEAGWKEVPQ